MYRTWSRRENKLIHMYGTCKTAIASIFPFTCLASKACIYSRQFVNMKKAYSVPLVELQVLPSGGFPCHHHLPIAQYHLNCCLNPSSPQQPPSAQPIAQSRSLQWKQKNQFSSTNLSKGQLRTWCFGNTTVHHQLGIQHYNTKWQVHHQLAAQQHKSSTISLQVHGLITKRHYNTKWQVHNNLGSKH
jgi:hypothetical protein